MNIRYLLLFLMVFCTHVNAQTVYSKQYFGNGAEYGRSITEFGGYIYTAGSTSSFGNGQSDAIISKLTLDGDLLWTKSYGGYYNESFNEIKVLSDGNLIACGLTSSYTNFTGPDSNMFVVKYDTSGSVIWSRTFGGPNTDVANDVVENLDGSLIVAGFTSSIGAGAKDIYLLKLDVNGNYVWSKALGSNQDEIATKIISAYNSGYVLSGHTNSFGLSGYYSFVLKVNDFGDCQWIKTYETTGVSPAKCYGNSIIKGLYDNYIFVGKKGMGFIGDAAPFVIDLDSLGALNWGKTYSINSGDCFANNVMVTSDNKYLISGSMMGSSPLLLKINPNGTTLWAQIYSPGGNLFKSINIGGTYVSVGYYFYQGDSKLSLFRASSTGQISTCTSSPFGGGQSGTYSPTINVRNINSTSTNFSLLDTMSNSVGSLSETSTCMIVSINNHDVLKTNVFPNPAAENLWIENASEIKSIEIQDINGKVCLNQNFITHETISLQSLSNGVYSLHIFLQNNLQSTQKLIVIH